MRLIRNIFLLAIWSYLFGGRRAHENVPASYHASSKAHSATWPSLLNATEQDSFAMHISITQGSPGPSDEGERARAGPRAKRGTCNADVVVPPNRTRFITTGSKSRVTLYFHPTEDFRYISVILKLNNILDSPRIQVSFPTSRLCVNDYSRWHALTVDAFELDVKRAADRWAVRASVGSCSPVKATAYWYGLSSLKVLEVVATGASSWRHSAPGEDCLFTTTTTTTTTTTIIPSTTPMTTTSPTTQKPTSTTSTTTTTSTPSARVPSVTTTSPVASKLYTIAATPTATTTSETTAKTTTVATTRKTTATSPTTPKPTPTAAVRCPTPSPTPAGKPTTSTQRATTPRATTTTSIAVQLGRSTDGGRETPRDPSLNDTNATDDGVYVTPAVAIILCVVVGLVVVLLVICVLVKHISRLRSAWRPKGPPPQPQDHKPCNSAVVNVGLRELPTERESGHGSEHSASSHHLQIRENGGLVQETHTCLICCPSRRGPSDAAPSPPPERVGPCGLTH
ncbi:flocculation protein FLO11-like [Penaeus japonicus]|uniref:flocculation protein FLO11-like n=1 Tax=Penaeus japonicus TaxID=27405 RepID=UPI001C715573|nr:flocculation protein FLO11-like [Penaeus japonicus]